MAMLYPFLALASLVSSASALTALPISSSTSTETMTAVATLAPVSSYAFTFTYTTPTTHWSAPAFATNTPTPSCSDTMCPAQDGKTCVDSGGTEYGVLCNARLSGTVITVSGKKLLMERHRGRTEEAKAAAELDKRVFTATFDNCGDYCDNYDDPNAPCIGISYHDGQCMAYAEITGSFAQTGNIAAIRKLGTGTGGDGLGTADMGANDMNAAPGPM
ncbi:hypothetical protein LTR97_001577 [Elasticomyces elasticus]|uniref:Kazal-like domain-containing protein n=1 Tax=Elasticomyces elasticus TaxID=574655 RepID=A0AAN7WHT1_9PEZI|nr:hypothetical protein LTR97_001577 [Elasticomyces elasticus]